MPRVRLATVFLQENQHKCRCGFYINASSGFMFQMVSWDEP